MVQIKKIQIKHICIIFSVVLLLMLFKLMFYGEINRSSIIYSASVVPHNDEEAVSYIDIYNQFSTSESIDPIVEISSDNIYRDIEFIKEDYIGRPDYKYNEEHINLAKKYELFYIGRDNPFKEIYTARDYDYGYSIVIPQNLQE